MNNNAHQQLPPIHLLDPHDSPPPIPVMGEIGHRANIAAIVAALAQRKEHALYKDCDLGRGLSRYIFHVPGADRLLGHWSEPIRLGHWLSQPQSLVAMGRGGAPEQMTFVVAHARKWKFGGLHSLVSSDSWKACAASVPLGLGEYDDGRKFLVDLGEIGSLGVFGTEGQGTLDYFLLGLLLRFKGDSLKLSLATTSNRWRGYEGLPHLAMPVATNGRELISVLEAVEAEMARRRELSSQAPNPVPPTPLVVILDGLDKLSEKSFEAAKTHVERIIRGGPRQAIYTLAYLPTPRVASAKFTRHIDFNGVLAFAMRGSEHSRIVIGDDRARRLFGQGDYLFQASHHASFLKGNMIYPSEIECGRILDFVEHQHERFLDWRPFSMPPFPPFQIVRSLENAFKVLRREGEISPQILQRHLGISEENAHELLKWFARYRVIRLGKDQTWDPLVNMVRTTSYRAAWYGPGAKRADRGWPSRSS